jgi:ABC-type nitrate/sulfonate/bicarbonate transport system substrate-binding protein
LKLFHTLKLLSLGLSLSVAASTSAAYAQQLDKVRIARLAFPAMGSMMLDVATERGFDKKHGLQVEAVSQSAIPSYYGMIANRDADLIVGGPLVFQKMFLEGVPLRIISTWAPLDVLAVIAADPAIKSLADLKGKSLAAAMGSAEYQVTAIYGRKLGLDFGKDVTVVSAAPPIARAQLEAKRVDAAMLWEPTTTLALRENSAFRVIMTGDAAWKAIANERGWNLVLAGNTDFLKNNGKLVPRVLAMLQETQKFMKDNVDATDAILTKTLKMQPGIYRDGVKAGRIVFDVLPVTGNERNVIWNMFKVAVDTDYLPKLPSQDIIFTPQ